MNTLEEAKALIHIEFGNKMKAIRLCFEIERDDKLRAAEIASSYFRDPEEPDELKTVTVGEVEEVRVDPEPMGFPDQAADGIPRMTVTVEKTAQGNLEIT